jgi:hypothetical protein
MRQVPSDRDTLDCGSAGDNVEHAYGDKLNVQDTLMYHRGSWA